MKISTELTRKYPNATDLLEICEKMCYEKNNEGLKTEFYFEDKSYISIDNEFGDLKITNKTQYRGSRKDWV